MFLKPCYNEFEQIIKYEADIQGFGKILPDSKFRQFSKNLNMIADKRTTAW